jgi:DNA (cytosine-5)-methyltransferase 1
MRKPRLLDLFSGEGGAAMGYYRAGFEVVGVDIVAQPNYPFTFYQADALTFPLDGFDVYHASPECKAYTNCNLSPKELYQKLIGAMREHLQATGKPYIIENVVGAKRDLHASLMLCGSMFGLPVERHRLFETNMFIYPPRLCNHADTHIGVYGHSIWDSSLPGTPRKDGRSRPDSVPQSIGRLAMGIDWMSRDGLAEAIPPCYTEWIGRQLMDVLEVAV